MNVRFCPACRSLILVDFRFCPYCGAAVKGPDLAEALEAPFGRMASAAPPRAAVEAPPDPALRATPGATPRGAADVFASVRESLDRLEADMDLILEELEKESRSST